MTLTHQQEKKIGQLLRMGILTERPYHHRYSPAHSLRLHEYLFAKSFNDTMSITLMLDGTMLVMDQRRHQRMMYRNKLRGTRSRQESVRRRDGRFPPLHSWSFAEENQENLRCIFLRVKFDASYKRRERHRMSLHRHHAIAVSYK